MVQQTRAVPRSGSVHRTRAGLAVRVCLRAVDVLPRDRPDLSPDGPRHHEGCALLPGDAAAPVHDAVVSRSHLADGAVGGGATGRRPTGERSGGRGVQGRRSQRAAIVPAGDGGVVADRGGDGGTDPGGEPGGERRVPAATVPDSPGTSGERAAGAHLQLDVRGSDDLRRGREHLAGGAAGHPGLRRARSHALADHLRARGPAAHRRGQPAHHAPHDERRRQRGRHLAGRRAQDDGGHPFADRRRRGRLAILVTYYLMMTSLEGAALRARVPAVLAIWAPNALFGTVGLGLLIATAREWRWPAMPAVWRVIEAVRRAMPGRPVWHPRHGTGGARDSTHIVDRYLVREYVTFMGIGLAVAAALFIVIDLLKTLDKYLRVKPPLMYILEHFAYRLPAALHDGLPVVMLVATIFLFLTLSRYHELTALKAAGVSLYRVSAPVLGVGLMVAIGAGLFQELALPVLNERGDEVDRVKIRGQAPRHLQSRQRLWVRSADTRFYRVELLNPGTNDLYGVTILELDREFRLTGRLDARRAHWTAGGWELSEGAYREIGPEGKVQTVAFGWTALDLKEELEDFLRIQKPVSTMSFWELRDYIGQLEAAGFQIRKYLVELYSKLSFPLVNLVMVLVAIPFALQSPRGGRLVGIGLAIVIMAGYLVVHYVALAFARADLLPPLIAAWTANGIFLGIGVSLLLRART